MRTTGGKKNEEEEEDNNKLMSAWKIRLTEMIY